ncbi:MAG: hypothetical protein JRI96_14055, partial [Deltaproteobacteria bacterium]|nr:hypothetical protein [Deltaproteobacteria bacterium]
SDLLHWGITDQHLSKGELAKAFAMGALPTGLGVAGKSLHTTKIPAIVAKQTKLIKAGQNVARAKSLYAMGRTVGYTAKVLNKAAPIAQTVLAVDQGASILFTPEHRPLTVGQSLKSIGTGYVWHVGFNTLGHLANSSRYSSVLTRAADWGRNFTPKGNFLWKTGGYVAKYGAINSGRMLAGAAANVGVGLYRGDIRSLKDGGWKDFGLYAGTGALGGLAAGGTAGLAKTAWAKTYIPRIAGGVTGVLENPVGFSAFSTLTGSSIRQGLSGDIFTKRGILNVGIDTGIGAFEGLLWSKSATIGKVVSKEGWQKLKLSRRIGTGLWKIGLPARSAKIIGDVVGGAAGIAGRRLLIAGVGGTLLGPARDLTNYYVPVKALDDKEELPRPHPFQRLNLETQKMEFSPGKLTTSYLKGWIFAEIAAYGFRNLTLDRDKLSFADKLEEKFLRQNRATPHQAMTDAIKGAKLSHLEGAIFKASKLANQDFLAKKMLLGAAEWPIVSGTMSSVSPLIDTTIGMVEHWVDHRFDIGKGQRNIGFNIPLRDVDGDLIRDAQGNLITELSRLRTKRQTPEGNIYAPLDSYGDYLKQQVLPEVLQSPRKGLYMGPLIGLLSKNPKPAPKDNLLAKVRAARQASPGPITKMFAAPEFIYKAIKHKSLRAPYMQLVNGDFLVTRLFRKNLLGQALGRQGLDYSLGKISSLTGVALFVNSVDRGLEGINRVGAYVDKAAGAAQFDNYVDFEKQVAARYPGFTEGERSKVTWALLFMKNSYLPPDKDLAILASTIGRPGRDNLPLRKVDRAEYARQLKVATGVLKLADSFGGGQRGLVRATTHIGRVQQYGRDTADQIRALVRAKEYNNRYSPSTSIKDGVDRFNKNNKLGITITEQDVSSQRAANRAIARLFNGLDPYQTRRNPGGTPAASELHKAARDAVDFYLGAHPETLTAKDIHKILDEKNESKKLGLQRYGNLKFDRSTLNDMALNKFMVDVLGSTLNPGQQRDALNRLRKPGSTPYGKYTIEHTSQIRHEALNRLVQPQISGLSVPQSRGLFRGLDNFLKSRRKSYRSGLLGGELSRQEAQYLRPMVLERWMQQLPKGRVTRYHVDNARSSTWRKVTSTVLFSKLAQEGRAGMETIFKLTAADKPQKVKIGNFEIGKKSAGYLRSEFSKMVNMFELAIDKATYNSLMPAKTFMDTALKPSGELNKKLTALFMSRIMLDSKGNPRTPGQIEGYIKRHLKPSSKDSARQIRESLQGYWGRTFSKVYRSMDNKGEAKLLWGEYQKVLKKVNGLSLDIGLNRGGDERFRARAQDLWNNNNRNQNNLFSKEFMRRDGKLAKALLARVYAEASASRVLGQKNGKLGTLDIQQQIDLSLKLQNNSTGLATSAGKTYTNIADKIVGKFLMGDKYQGRIFVDSNRTQYLSRENLRLIKLGGMKPFDVAQGFHSKPLSSVIAAFNDSNTLIISDSTATPGHLRNIWATSPALKKAMLKPAVQTIDEVHEFLLSQDAAIISDGDARLSWRNRGQIRTVKKILKHFQGENGIPQATRKIGQGGRISDYLNGRLVRPKGKDAYWVKSLDGKGYQLSDAAIARLGRLARGRRSQVVQSVIRAVDPDINLGMRGGYNFGSRTAIGVNGKRTVEKFIHPIDYSGKPKTRSTYRDTNFQIALAVKNNKNPKDVVRISKTSMQTAVSTVVANPFARTHGTTGTIEGLELLSKAKIGSRVFNISAPSLLTKLHQRNITAKNFTTDEALGTKRVISHVKKGGTGIIPVYDLSKDSLKTLLRSVTGKNGIKRSNILIIDANTTEAKARRVAEDTNLKGKLIIMGPRGFTGLDWGRQTPKWDAYMFVKDAQRIPSNTFGQLIGRLKRKSGDKAKYLFHYNQRELEQNLAFRKNRDVVDAFKKIVSPGSSGRKLVDRVSLKSLAGTGKHRGIEDIVLNASYQQARKMSGAYEFMVQDTHRNKMVTGFLKRMLEMPGILPSERQAVQHELNKVLNRKGGKTDLRIKSTLGDVYAFQRSQVNQALFEAWGIWHKLDKKITSPVGRQMMGYQYVSLREVGTERGITQRGFDAIKSSQASLFQGRGYKPAIAATKSAAKKIIPSESLPRDLRMEAIVENFQTTVGRLNPLANIPSYYAISSRVRDIRAKGLIRGAPQWTGYLTSFIPPAKSLSQPLKSAISELGTSTPAQLAEKHKLSDNDKELLAMHGALGTLATQMAQPLLPRILRE